LLCVKVTSLYQYLAGKLTPGIPLLPQGEGVKWKLALCLDVGEGTRSKAMGDRVRSYETGVGEIDLSNGNVDRDARPANNILSTIPLVREKRLRLVLQRLETQLPHSVRELAEQVHLSPAHLQRLFKQETGVHLSDLVSARRLNAAAELLTTTDMEVKQIAYFVGYGHHSSFVRAFHKRFGQSPKRYRQRCA
jgi:AraC-like DNA-binding protein